MNTNLIICAVAVTSAFASCKTGGDSTFELSIKGLPAHTECYVEVMPISPIGEPHAVDTVRFADGRLSWSLPESDTLYQVVFTPALSDEYDSMFLINAFAGSSTKMEIEGEYLGNAIKYAIEGDDLMSRYAAREMDMRNAASLKKSDQERWQVQDEYMRECVEYAKTHPSDPISAIYLCTMADDATLAKYSEMLADEVRHGDMEELIDVRLRYYNMKTRVRDDNDQPRIGAAMPGFACRDINGDEIRLDQFTGKYVVLDFWGSWCRWCMAGIEPMGRLYHDHKDKMVLIGVNSRDTEEKYRKAIADHNMDWPQIAVAEGTDTDLATLYAVGAFPTKVVIAPDGTLALYWEGEDEEFYDRIKTLLM